MKRWLIALVIVFILALIGGAGYLGLRSVRGQDSDAFPTPQTISVTRGDVAQTVTAPGQLVGTRQATLSMDVGGRLVEVNARPGESVHKGDVLAQMDTTPFDRTLQEARLRVARADAEHQRQLAEAAFTAEAASARLTQAEAEHAHQLAEAEIALQIAQARLAQARIGYPSIVAAEIGLKRAIADVADAQDAYKKALDRPWEPAHVAEGLLRALYDVQDALAVAQAEYEAVQKSQAATAQELRVLESDVDRAQIALERLQAGIDPTLALALKSAQKALANLTEAGVDPLLELAVQDAQADLKATTLIAPFDGVVLTVHVNPNEGVGVGQGILVLADPAAVEVEATVIEEDVPLIQIGQPAELFFDALPEAYTGAQIARISPLRVSDERPLYPVYIQMDTVPHGLAPGMTVDASIVIASRTDVLRLPRTLVRARSDGTAQAKVWVNGQTAMRTVRVGLRGDVYVEILEGLREGERVIGQ
jgi:RND family efflux transporter MFP subunit